MTQREINRLVALEGQCGYNHAAKTEFCKLSMKLMRELRETLGMFSADVRYNAGGIAVSGEATMHGDVVYVQVSDFRLGILYRTCKGQRDYTGGRNNWFSFDRLKATGVKGLAASVAQLLSRNESSQYVGSLDEQLRNESLGGE